jgi:uncharacterized protein
MLFRNYLCALSLLCSCVLAQNPSKVHFVRASAEATVVAKPDRAEISVGVLTQAPTAQSASEQNARQSSQVLDAIRQALSKGGELKTTGYSISPEYQYANNRPIKITGYQANNTVLVTVNDLSLLGKVIDAATGSGANNINGVSFSLRDEEAVRSQALADAAVKARVNAEAMARALNLKVVSVLDAETTVTPIVRPLTRAAFAMAKEAPTPVEPGNLDIHASVTVTLEVQ